VALQLDLDEEDTRAARRPGSPALPSHLPISRRHEQPATNGGNWFAFDGVRRKLLHVGWRSIDAPTPESCSSI
jgi:hypothetical protein